MINPPDARVAARSFPRRWRELFAGAGEGDEGLDVLHRSGALELAREAASVLGTTADRIHGGGRTSAWIGDPEGLDAIDQRGEDLARTIDQVDPEDWSDDRMHALDTGIAEAAALLRRAETAIEEARAARGG